MATIESNFESICINPNDDLVLYKKEIVRSRIEKFLYAICSLDTDDLPTPLSRIEELYNCLVTGEDIPTFTPLSRAEKFVMAMLGAYDVELLPTPISRSETLMKKIATGDNNLDDIDNLQSRYEFLLAYIIKAGGFNGGSGDFYYKLTSLTSSFTTIYNTLDMPVKNAVLRGQTLVNLVKKLTPENHGDNKEWGVQGSSNPTHTWNSNGSITITSTIKGSMVLNYYNLTLFKPNTEYTLFVSVGWNGVGVTPYLSKISTNDIPLNNGLNIVKFTTASDLTVQNISLRLGYIGTVAVGCEYTFNNIMVLEGDWINVDIPYFEGMQSVKTPVLTTVGKNLFDSTLEYGDFNNSTGITNNTSTNIIRTKEYNEILPNMTYRLTVFNATSTLSTFYVHEYDNEFNYIKSTNSNVFTTHTNTKYVKFRFRKDDNTAFTEAELAALSCMITEGDIIPNTYEPYKSTAVLCNEEVELRKIGDMRDELNLVTGELIQRVAVYTFTGDEPWMIGEPTEGTKYFLLRERHIKPQVLGGVSAVNLPLICNRVPTIKYSEFTMDNSGINFTYDLRMNFADCNCNQGATVEDLKAYLKANPTTIYYPITEVVKTVDLSTLDQDGKKTKLNTFNDITHVTVSSEGLVPTGDIDIARPIQFVDYSLDNSLTTLYNTVEYPVKSAILKGNTLVNLFEETDIDISNPPYLTIKGKVTELKAETKYTVKYFNVPIEKTKQLRIVERHGSYDDTVHLIPIVGNETFTTRTEFSTFKELIIQVIETESGSISKEELSEVKILLMEGDYTNVDIPYFTGMSSVKMPVLTTSNSTIKVEEFMLGSTDSNGNITIDESGDNLTNFIKVSSNTKYTIKFNNFNKLASIVVIYYDENRNFINRTINPANNVLTTPSNCEFVVIRFYSNPKLTGSIELYLTDNGYEPHKSNILTCNEEVELRGIGDIKDELNLVTGELTQRVGSVTIDDSYSWRLNTGMNGEQETHLVFQSNYIFNDYKYDASNSNITNDRFSLVGFGGNANKAGEWLTIGSNGLLYVKINKNKLDTHDIDGFKKWLLQNPIIIQYELTTESVKTVDLSTLDQNEDVLLILENGEYINTENGDYIKVGIKGEKTKLNTFDDITYVIVSSEGLVPTGEITVATKNATDVADASVMSLRMDDILNSQRTLEGPANAQSDDIDVAMLGTTDIYEQLL